MYSLDNDKSTESTNKQKVLVFSKNNIHFGMIVDSVNSIVTFSDGDKIKLPELLYSQGEGTLSADVSEAVEITDSTGAKRSMLILSAESIATRVAKSLAA